VFPLTEIAFVADPWITVAVLQKLSYSGRGAPKRELELLNMPAKVTLDIGSTLVNVGVQ
jgi:hypothetical protein